MSIWVRQLPVSSHVNPRAAIAVVLILLLLYHHYHYINLKVYKCVNALSQYCVDCNVSSIALYEQSIYLMERLSTASLLPETPSKTTGATVWIFVILISDVNFMIITCRSSLTTSHRYPQHTRVISKGSLSDTSIFTNTVTYTSFSYFMFIVCGVENNMESKHIIVLSQ
jgi:hypothetical protein